MDEIGEILTKEGLNKLRIGQVLMFNYEGCRNEYKITRINRKAHKCWVKRIRTYHPDEVTITDKLGDEVDFKDEWEKRNT